MRYPQEYPVGIAHCQHFHNSVIALFSVAVDAISLVWLHHVGIAAVKIRDGLHRRPAQRAALLLRQEPHAGVAEIAGRVGYDSASKFAAAFKAVKGKTPLEYRREGQ